MARRLIADVEQSSAKETNRQQFGHIGRWLYALNRAAIRHFAVVQPSCFIYTPHTTCGTSRSFAVIVFAKARVLVGIFSEYLRKAVL